MADKTPVAIVMGSKSDKPALDACRKYLDHFGINAHEFILSAHRTPKETIELVRPHVLVKGAEYQEKDIVGAKFVSSYGGEVTRIRMKPGYSTRNLIRKVSGTGV